MVCRIIQRSCLLEVTECGSEFPCRHARGAEHPMGNTQRRRVFMSFGLGKELYGCVSLLGAFASDIVACPNPIEDGKFLRGIGKIVKACLGPQQDLSRLGCRVAAIGDHLLDRASPPIRAPDARVRDSREAIPAFRAPAPGARWPPHWLNVRWRGAQPFGNTQWPSR